MADDQNIETGPVGSCEQAGGELSSPVAVGVDEIHELLKDPSQFTIKRVLKNNTSQKQICIEGELRDREGSALIILEKKIFPKDESVLAEGFFNKETSAKELYHNDIYSGYDFFPQAEHNGLNATLIYPATEKHIEKFTISESFMVEESPDVYEMVSLPKILQVQEQYSLKWVENILDGSAEADRVIYNDPDEEVGFVLVKDLKWDDELSTLYLIAIARKNNIKSIRDLNESHLPLLRNIKEAGLKAISEKYGISKKQLRVYLHYQPSYYHLHVHFTSFSVENTGTFAERAHLLSSVINNIEMMPDYYQKAVLSFRVFKASLFEPYDQYEREKESKNGPQPTIESTTAV